MIIFCHIRHYPCLNVDQLIENFSTAFFNEKEETFRTQMHNATKLKNISMRITSNFRISFIEVFTEGIHREKQWLSGTSGVI